MANKKVSENIRRIQHGIRLPRYLVKWLNDQEESNSIIIEKALVEKFNISVPIEFD